MSKCKLLVYYTDEMSVFSGTIENSKPFKIRIPGFADVDKSLPAGYRLKFDSDGSPKFVHLKYSGEKDGLFEFEAVSEIRNDSQDSHFIEFREYLDIAKADETKLGDFRHKVDKINNRFRSSLTNHIKKVITDETLTNQYILKLLMQIDSKMDEMLDTMKHEETIDGIKPRKVIAVGGEGLTFVTDERLIENDHLYVQSLPKDGTGMNFAALCIVSDVLFADGSYICTADFIYIDENTRENIIHFIFQKEREQLKRTRN